MRYSKMSALIKILPQNFSRIIITSTQSLTCRHYSPHPETPPIGLYDNHKGKACDKKPFPIELEAGKKYAWCTCGNSRTQPFCDGSHKQDKKSKVNVSLANKIQFTPHRFEVTETKKYWLCMCKQTNNRPFCDGSHKSEEIQKKIFA